MTKNINVLAAMAAMLCLASCSNKIDNVADVLSAIKLSQAPDNVLRYYVDLDFSSPCTYRVDYWESADPATKKSTREFESAGISYRTHYFSSIEY